MSISIDLTTEDIRTGTTSPQTFSHGGAASGVKGVVLRLVHGASSTDHVSAASYGGVALTRIQRNTDTANEPGAAEIWFLGEGVPQGTQTVSYTPGATTDDFHAVVSTLLAATDLEVIDQDGIDENVADPSVTLQYGGREAMAFAALYGGGAAPSSFTANANCTVQETHDLGAFYSVALRQTTPGTADFAIGGTASTDDVAFSAIAVSEVVTPPVEVDLSYSHVGTASAVKSVGKPRAYSHVGALIKQRAVTVGAKAYSHVGTAAATKSVALVAKAYTHTASLVTTVLRVFLLSLSYAHTAVLSLTKSIGLPRSYSHTGTATKQRAVSLGPRAYAHVAAMTALKSVALSAKAYSHAAALATQTTAAFLLSKAYSHVGTLVQSRAFIAAKSLAYTAVHTLVTATQFIAGSGPSVTIRRKFGFWFGHLFR